MAEAARGTSARLALLAVTMICLLADRSHADSWNNLHSCVVSIADLDGDGIRDLLVANRAQDQPDCIWAISGKSGKVLYRVTGLAAHDGFGGALAEIGDVDRDGVSDFAASALRGGWVTADTVEWSYVRFVSGKDGHAVRDITAPSRSDQLGYSLSVAGDADGDGVPDVLVGNPTAELAPDGPQREETGACLVISGADGSTLRTIRAPQPKSGFGSSVAWLGDIDHDGKPDWAVGAPKAATVHIFSGKDGSLVSTLVAGETGLEFGWCIASVPCTDTVSGWLAISESSRYVRLWSLPELKPGTTAWSHTRTCLDDFGSSIDFVRAPATRAITGVIIGANETSPGFDEGYAEIQPLDGSRPISLASGETWQGFDVCALDDVDGDGVCDVVVVYAKDMQVCVLSGKDRATLRVISLGPQPREQSK